ncbi:antibiotic biosynthesis monooxygenase [Spirochaeta isovalerica]|uniref:Autoinducer 2-degrading protein n=1 Tax=Spirochaeta isovalerica TaxID=150 RepID=A0A841RFC6_9SPIO|nr:antibiotic biosynthesis monooxygenase [Spirochaeta isovalerica]MBB6482091.1 autoinducer 2-degrading protein [Spirochaeta isovalerica]
MVVYCVNVFVKQENIQAFIEATEVNHRETRKEPGNLRFDVIQHDEDKSRFMLYEVYKSPEAVAAHKETDHYLSWRNTVAPFMAKDREGVRFSPLFPEEEKEW